MHVAAKGTIAAAVAAAAWCFWTRSRTARRRTTTLDAAAARQLLATVDTVVFDCDGVLWAGSKAIEGAARCISALHAAGKRTLFMTNNSEHSREQLLEKFRAKGFEGVTREMIYSSGYVTALYLKQRPPPADRPTVFAVGADGLCEELRAVGLRVEGGAAYARRWANATMEAVQDELLAVRAADESIGVVVTGMNVFVNYFTLCRAGLALQREGTRFIATNADRLTPQREGLILPAGGTSMGALSYATGREATVIGKPSQYALEAILADVPEMRRATTLMVGDRLDTDIAFGRAGGLRTLLVLSGCHTAADASAAQGDAALCPEAMASSVAVLADACEAPDKSVRCDGARGPREKSEQ